MRNPTHEDKLAEYVTKHKIKCKYCGSKIFMIESFKEKRVLCGHCKRYIYKNPLDEFKDKLKVQIRREEENDTHKD